MFERLSRFIRPSVSFRPPPGYTAEGRAPGRLPAGTTALKNLSGQTKKAMTALLLIAGLGLALLTILAFNRENGLHFLTWSVIAASSALVVGGALGLLFGLPTATTTTVITTNSAPSPAPASPAPAPETMGGIGTGTTGSGPVATPPAEASAAASAPPMDSIDIGYRDSTSLEQVADWLTKIIIGLSLTQWDDWEDRFTQLAANLTVTLLGPPARGQSPAQYAVPGGILLALYAVIGFLACYLWMRRYFILEMVTAKREARDAMARQFEENQRLHRHHTEQAALATIVAAARARGLAPGTAPTPSGGPTQEVLVGALRKGIALLPADCPGTHTLTSIINGFQESSIDPEDPWRGKFGGHDNADDVSLNATVTAMSDPNMFRIELAVRPVLPGSKAIYFLHPTFGLDPRVSTSGADGRAPLEIYAWGAFTVGVVLESGTMLELNLATLPGAPDSFRMR